MPDHLGDDMRKTKTEENKEEKEFKGTYIDALEVYNKATKFVTIVILFHFSPG